MRNVHLNNELVLGCIKKSYYFRRLVKKMFYTLPNPRLLDGKEDLVEENA